jgi:hypothetical protein
MLVILTEEASMKVFLEVLINRNFPALQYRIIAHQGKQDLEKHIPIVLKSWKTPDSRFIIVHDQDSWDCRMLKTALQTECETIRTGVIIRIACVELEAWYWGDLKAVSEAFNKPKLPQLSRRSTYRIPDEIENPKAELQRHIPRYEQLSGARAIAEHLDAERNTSHSFNVFYRSLKEIASKF